MKVVIIGAGIGGLATALSLHAAGIDCQIYEAVPEILPLGVGINLLPHAIKELTDLGLLDDLKAAGVMTREVIYVTRRGESIWTEPRGEFAGYRWPQISIHRGTLQMLLYRAVVDRLGADVVRPGHRFVRQRQSDGRIAVDLQRPDGTIVTDDSGDVLVGADGIHSALRASFYPDEGPPVWAGMTLWRGTTIAPPFLSGATMVIAGNANTKFVCYPIENRKDGTKLINWIADVRTDAVAFRSAADWNRRGAREAFLPRYEDWSTAVLDIPALVKASGAIYEYPMVDRDPLPAWTFGRATLIGDAAHAMYPIGSNGAAQAVVDARRLALELSRDQSIDAALAAYENARRPPMTKLLAAHRAEGADVVLELLEQRAPNGYSDVESVLPMREREEIAAGYKQMAGFDIATINAQPPMTPTRPGA